MSETMVERIKKMLYLRGVSLRSMSISSGVPYMTMVNLMNTGGDNTKLPTLRRIAEYFSITLDELIDGIKEDHQTQKEAPAPLQEQELTDKQLDEWFVTLPPNIKNSVFQMVEATFAYRDDLASMLEQDEIANRTLLKADGFELSTGVADDGDVRIS